MGKGVKYPQSVSFGDLFPDINGMPGSVDPRLHHAMKRYRIDVAAGKPNGGFAKFLEKQGLYTEDEIMHLKEQFPDSFESRTINPRKRNGHRGGVYPKDGK